MLEVASLAAALYLAAPAPLTEDMSRKAEVAAGIVDAGNVLCMASLWTVPFVYDMGILTMMGAKKSLKGQYIARYGEEATDFEESGHAAYWWGWGYKAGAIAALYLLLPGGGGLTSDPLIGIAAFVPLWLMGTAKHYEASRKLYEQGHYLENGILDPNPPVVPAPQSAGPIGFKVSIAF